MTYAQLMNEATKEQLQEVRERVVKIIGTKKDAVAGITDTSKKIKARFDWDRNFEQLAKVFLEHGEKALAMNYSQISGNTFKGVTANGKHWLLEGNNGVTTRSRYCGTLYIEGEGTIFTSGKLDKAFEYILNN